MTPTQTLPDTPMQARAANDLLARPQTRGRTLLLVEDSRQASDSIRLMFQGAQGRLRRVDSLSAARRHLSLYLPDAVLIDLGLPDGSGLDLIHEMDKHRPRIPLIIAISGQPDMATAAMQAGADRFLAKPFQSVTEFRSALSPIFFGRADMPIFSQDVPPNPCALRDDLYLALDLLCGEICADNRRYALQFIATLARMTRDNAMSMAVADARESGVIAELAQLLRQRLQAQPLI